MKRSFIFLISLLLAAPVHAQEPESLLRFFFPVACTLGTDCWTVNYVDIDPAPGAAKDFSCGIKTYDEHKGTDFGLKNLAAVKTGVDVLAAAPGKIARTRDGESDGEKTEEQLQKIKDAKRECGNAVLIDHGNGVQTLYCHLKLGSVVVKPGDAVTAAQKIAQVGQSGMAPFPHLHFGVVRGADIVDPFTNLKPDSTCGTPEKSMWSLGLPMKYEALSLFNAGFYAGTPDFDLIKKEDMNSDFIATNSLALSFWAGIYNAQKDDVITLTITAPDGKQFARSVHKQDSPAERQYVFTGRDQLSSLEKGLYKATAVIARGDLTQTMERTIEVR